MARARYQPRLGSKPRSSGPNSLAGGMPPPSSPARLVARCARQRPHARARRNPTQCLHRRDLASPGVRCSLLRGTYHRTGFRQHGRRRPHQEQAPPWEQVVQGPADDGTSSVFLQRPHAKIRTSFPPGPDDARKQLAMVCPRRLLTWPGHSSLAQKHPGIQKAATTEHARHHAPHALSARWRLRSPCTVHFACQHLLI